MGWLDTAYAKVVAKLVPQGECLVYTGQKTNGYGKLQLTIDGVIRYFRAHRIVCAYHNGESDQPVLHSCDNKLCCNPKHIRYGTHAENEQEKRDRLGTHATQKLDYATAYHIKFNCKLGCRKSAALHGVSPATVKDIRAGRTWRELCKTG